MALRLRAAGAPRWMDLPHGVRVLCKPVTSATVAASQSAGRRRVASLPADERADPDFLAGLAFQVTVAEIARFSILEWTGVVGDDDEPAPVTPETIDLLLMQEDMAFAFWSAATETLHEVVAEGNG